MPINNRITSLTAGGGKSFAVLAYSDSEEELPTARPTLAA
jgi:hypothetical protein